MSITEAFDFVSTWPDLPPYDEGIGVGGAYRDTAYAVLSELLPDCHDEDDLRLAVGRGQLDEKWRGEEGVADYWRCHRLVHAAINRRRIQLETQEVVPEEAGC
jgi:hypothetical protein